MSAAEKIKPIKRSLSIVRGAATGAFNDGMAVLETLNRKLGTRANTIEETPDQATLLLMLIELNQQVARIQGKYLQSLQYAAQGDRLAAQLVAAEAEKESTDAGVHVQCEPVPAGGDHGESVPEPAKDTVVASVS